MVYKKYDNESFNLYTVKTDKFKTCHMEIIFYNNLDSELITKENVLADIISYTNKKYNKRKLVVEHLEDLYNANFYSTTSRIGNVRTINFLYDFIDPVYTEKLYLKDVISFPFEMLFNPNIKADEFDEKALKLSKNKIHADIKSIKESPLSYAIKRSLIKTNKNMPASNMIVGNIKDLNKINSTNLYDFYKYFMNNYKCDIFLLGNLNMDKINIMIKELFLNNTIKVNELNPFVNNDINYRLKDIVEKDSFEQSTLINLFTINNISEYEQNYVMPVFNSIFGSGSLTNKLYQNLREKNSLCYNVASLYHKYDNLLIVATGIDAKNKNKSTRLIKKSLKEMVNAKFTKEDVENAIKNVINGLKASLDSPNSILDNYFFYTISNSPLIKDKIDNIDKVTKKDIVELAKKIKLITIYLMEGTSTNERD